MELPIQPIHTILVGSFCLNYQRALDPFYDVGMLYST